MVVTEINRDARYDGIISEDLLKLSGYPLPATASSLSDGFA